MDLTIIAVASFLVAIMTFFSGFGLGTLLTPVFMLFFPVELAIALTGIVHFFNNVFKLFLVGRNANRSVLVKFGIPAVIASFVGAWVLLQISGLGPLFTYTLNGREIEVSSVKFIIAILLIAFAMMDLLPALQKIQFSKKHLPVGGALSGFFGGLSGNQGALRSAFLIRAGMSKEAFIGTGVVISCFVDFTRLTVYASRFAQQNLLDHVTPVLIATLSAIAGAFLGNRLLKKITIHFVQLTIAVLLVIVAIGLGSGLL